MTKRILLTGAAGFTGARFTEAAHEAGYIVLPLLADLLDAKAITTEVLAAAPDYVVHLAGISAVTHADEEAIYRVNLFGTLNLLKALVALPSSPERIILVSSANVYGNADQSPIDETICPAPVNHYAMSKLAMEYMSATFAERLPLITVRPFNYTGVGHDTRFIIPKLVDHFVRKADTIELGNLKVEREFNDVRTVCDIYLRLLLLGKAGEAYNICSGRPVSLLAAIDALKSITGHEIQVKVNPAFVRANEVHRLCGNPTKLEACIGPIHHPSLEDTLRWMLESQA
jgi:nucleoside-diphosphate-sugar epimerase